MNIAIILHKSLAQTYDPVASLFIDRAALSDPLTGQILPITKLYRENCPIWLTCSQPISTRHPYMGPCFRCQSNHLPRTPRPLSPRQPGAISTPVTAVSWAPGCRQKEQRCTFLFHICLPASDILSKACHNNRHSSPYRWLHLLSSCPQTMNCHNSPSLFFIPRRFGRAFNHLIGCRPPGKMTYLFTPPDFNTGQLSAVSCFGSFWQFFIL